MPFQIKPLKTLRVSVAGTLPGDRETCAQKFSFELICKRLSQTEIDEALSSKTESVKDFLNKVAQDWEGVQDEKGQPLVFDANTFNAVLDEPGLRTICFNAYMQEIGAKAKG